MQNRDLCSRKIALLLLCAAMVLHGRASAQCANNLSIRTYDTLLMGPGYGTYHLSFPKWHPDSGLLVSVKISALVNVQYGFSLKNADVLAGSYSLWVGREDLISSPSMPASYDNITEQKMGVYPLDPGEQVVMPSFPFLSNYNNIDSIATATAPFLGTGQVNFTYSPITYTNIHASNNASYSYHASASEVTRFSLGYIYCAGNVVLASGLTTFNAALKDPASVQLDWSIAGEEEGRLYEIQRSREGGTFVTIGSRPSHEKTMGSADYTYLDHLPAVSGYQRIAGGKWLYRLRVITPGGISYSAVKEVAAGETGMGKLVVYPNPAVDHISLVLPGDPNQPGDWRVDIRASDGRLVQRADFFHTNSFFLNFRQNLSPGVYFIRATDLQGHDSRVASFRVDGR